MMTDTPKKKTETDDAFDALFTGELVPPVVMDEGNGPDPSTDE